MVWVAHYEFEGQLAVWGRFRAPGCNLPVGTVAEHADAGAQLGAQGPVTRAQEQYGAFLEVFKTCRSVPGRDCNVNVPECNGT